MILVLHTNARTTVQLIICEYMTALTATRAYMPKAKCFEATALHTKECQ